MRAIYFEPMSTWCLLFFGILKAKGPKKELFYGFKVPWFKHSRVELRESSFEEEWTHQTYVQKS